MNQNKDLSETAGSLNLPKIVTIGVYGYGEETFFQSLREAGVDAFCDIRNRRGVRGATYAFANSKRLQNRLLKLEIQYHHLPELVRKDKIARPITTTSSGLLDLVLCFSFEFSPF